MKLDKFLGSDSFASSTSRGLIAGVIGGLVGTAVKGLIEEFLPVRKIEDPSARIKIMDELSTKLTGSPISIQNESIVEQLVSLPIGASVGAAYGYGKKDKDDYNITDGVILGASTWFSTHETSLPLMGLKPNPTDVPLKMQFNELLAHVAFGITTEIVRSAVNEKLKSNRGAKIYSE